MVRKENQIVCGITAYWAKEAILGQEQWNILLRGATDRGQNGIGITVINGKSYSIFKREGCSEEEINLALSFLKNEVKLGSIVLLLCRATPETEKETTIEMLQPIVNDELYLIHNGGITDSLRKELTTFPYRTNIDSEMILAAYRKFGNNMKDCMEWLVGSFAFVLYDPRKEKLYAVTSFNPLAHMYVRGYGYFLHSDNDCLSKVLFSLTGQTQDGVNIWESFYHHYLQGFSILETDIQSGFQFKQSYTPRFLHPTWGNRIAKDTKALVVSSGGIDSGLTAFVLNKIGYDVTLVHFLYNQKAMHSELWAVTHLAEYLDCNIQVIDLRSFYKSLPEKGMLTSDTIPIDTGGDLIKSTIAWSSGRNAVFASMAMATAESMITSNLARKVLISAGWYQLSEETGGYPDNSFQFNESLESLKTYGYISGSRIKFLPIMQQLTKTEEWILGGALDFPFELTVSCDDPKIVNTHPYLCVECGSTRLSILASDRSGVPDKRLFLSPRPKLSEKMNNPPVEDIINRLLLSGEDKNKLKSLL